MTKNFNTLLSMNAIINCYKNNDFPNAHCLLWNKETGVNLLNTESKKVVETENKKGVEING